MPRGAPRYPLEVQVQWSKFPERDNSLANKGLRNYHCILVYFIRSNKESIVDQSQSSHTEIFGHKKVCRTYTLFWVFFDICQINPKFLLLDFDILKFWFIKFKATRC